MTRTSAPSLGSAARGAQGHDDAVAIQPHGLLLVLRGPSWRVAQASTNASAMLGRPLDTLLLATLRDLGGNLETQLRALADAGPLSEPQVLQCELGRGATCRRFEGSVHRVDSQTLVLELEPLAIDAAPRALGDGRDALLEHLGQQVRLLSSAHTLASLADGTVRAVRELTGFDQVLVYALAARSPGKVVAEARGPQAAPRLGEALAALELSPVQRAQRLRQRVQWLADAAAPPCRLVPEVQLGLDGAIDLSGASLLRPPAAQARALRELGLAAQLSVAVVRDGALWGLLVGLHAGPRSLRQGLRAAVDLLAEVMVTRMAAIESHARAQVAAQMRALEARLLEATSFDGDWPHALFGQPHSLLTPLAASGAVLWHEGQCLACGSVPPAEQMPALQHWLDGRDAGQPWHSGALGREHPTLSGLGERAAGVLAVRLSSAPGHHLAWLRPAHPASAPGAALPWTHSEIDLAASFGRALVDLIVQVNAVRMLIAESQLSQLRATVASAQEAVVVLASATPGAFYANDAFYALAGCRRDACATLHDMTLLFEDAPMARRVMGHVRAEQRAWQGELTLRRPDGPGLPVAVRAEPVPAGEHGLLGTVFIFEDLSTSKRIDHARRALDAALQRTSRSAPSAAESPGGQALVGAIIANASLAAMDIADSGATQAAAPMLLEVQASMARATALFDRIRRLGERRN